MCLGDSKKRGMLKKIVSVAIICCCVGGYGFDTCAVDVSEIYSNKQSTKYKITLSDNIYKITDINGVQIIPEQVSGKSILFSNGGRSKVRVYVNKDKYIVVNLQADNVVKDKIPPIIDWKYKDIMTNEIRVKLHDDAGVYQVNSVSGGESARVIFTKMPKSAQVSLEMPDEGGGIDIYDVFGNAKVLLPEDITLSISRAVKNINGDSVLLKLNDSAKMIQGITYVDGELIDPILGGGVDRTYITHRGTTQVNLNYSGNKKITLLLDTDVKSPDIVRAYRGGANLSRVFLEAQDRQSGIRKISFYNSSDNVYDIIKEIVGVQEVEIASSDIADGCTHVYVYDGVSNATKLDISEMVVDDVSPKVSMDYADGCYTLRIEKDKSGIDSVKLDNVDVDIYENCPVGEFSYNFVDLEGDSKVRACDGIGNVTEVTVNETMCTARRLYKNASGSWLSIDVGDQRGIQKITDGDEHPIERFLEDTHKVRGFYKVRPNTNKIKIFYQDDKSYALDLEELTSSPVVTEEVCVDGLISRCKVSSKAGIREVRYKDGRKISFKEDLPDDITVSCTAMDKVTPTCVTVYDAVGNSVDINKN